MENKKLKVTVEHGRENDFIDYCEINGIYYEQYPDPITWAFSVEMHESLAEELLGTLDYIKKIEPMPMIGISDY